MKKALRMGLGCVVVAGTLAVATSPARAVVCTDGCPGGGDTTGTGVAHAFTRSGNLQVAENRARLGDVTLPPNPVHPGDPYSPGFGVLTARPLGAGS